MPLEPSLSSYLRTVCPDLPLSLCDQFAQAVTPTPLLHSVALNDWLGREVSLKLENRQHGGSFKWRGVWLRLKTLAPDQRSQGLVCVSGGNFGRAVALAARLIGVPATVFLPVAACSPAT